MCASAFERRGVRVDLIPPRASMGALIVEIARKADDQPSVEQKQSSDGVVAIFTAQDVSPDAIDRVIGALSADASIAVLAGKTRRSDRLVEQAGIARGVPVQRFQPLRDGVHPGDAMIRSATRVLILTGNGQFVGVGRLLRLAGRYAKPVQVIDATAPHTS